MKDTVGCMIELQKATAVCSSEMLSPNDPYVRLVWV